MASSVAKGAEDTPEELPGAPGLVELADEEADDDAKAQRVLNSAHPRHEAVLAFFRTMANWGVDGC